MPNSKRLRFTRKTRPSDRHRWIRSFDQFTNLSEVEDRNDRQFLIRIATQAATNAINENKAMQIPITFMEGEWVVRRMPDGRIERISRIEMRPGAARSRPLTKGAVLHVDRKR